MSPDVTSARGGDGLYAERTSHMTQPPTPGAGPMWHYMIPWVIKDLRAQP
jgi:hypothetical protein